MQCAHDILIGNIQDLLSPDRTSSEILIGLLNSPVILHLDKSIKVNPLYKSTHYNSKFFTSFRYAQNGYIILRAIPLKHTTRGGGGPHFEIGQTPFRSATIGLPPHVRTIFFQYIPPFRRDFLYLSGRFSLYVCMYVTVCTHLFKLKPTICLLKMSLLKYFYRMFFLAHLSTKCSW